MDTGLSEAEPSDPESMVMKFRREVGAQPSISEEKDDMDEETELHIVNKVEYLFWLLWNLFHMIFC